MFVKVKKITLAKRKSIFKTVKHFAKYLKLNVLGSSVFLK